MAKIIFEDKVEEVDDGSPIMEACRKLGIPFGCSSGVCGVCTIKVLEGMENLNERTEEEDDLELEDDERLACKCKILKGEVKISY